MGNIIVNLIVIVIINTIVILIIRQSIALNKEKRISEYAIDSIRGKSDSVFDKIVKIYKTYVVKVRKRIEKYSFVKNVASRYNKYILIGDSDNVVDFIVNKIFISLMFLFIVMISYAMQAKSLGVFRIFIFLIIGYYLYDIYLIVRSKRRIKLIQRDMLKAVMIMNNAFKSGKSTMQAVYIASRDLPSPINYEFKKIYKDMKYGLDASVVFDRFAKRVDIEEARYLASSLTILNKTGGNIVTVFSSIEKTLFDRKKLEEELKNLTSASNFVTKILLFVPIVFVLIIYMLNPEYFNPLFVSPLGYMLIIICIIMLAIYVYLLNKIMKVRY